MLLLRMVCSESICIFPLGPMCSHCVVVKPEHTPLQGFPNSLTSLPHACSSRFAFGAQRHGNDNKMISGLTLLQRGGSHNNVSHILDENSAAQRQKYIKMYETILSILTSDLLPRSHCKRTAPGLEKKWSLDLLFKLGSVVLFHIRVRLLCISKTTEPKRKRLLVSNRSRCKKAP